MLRPIRIILAGLAAGLFFFAATSPAQTISIVTGNGQAICPTCPVNTPGFFFAPAVVAVTSSAGTPMPGATVTWKATYYPQNLAAVTVTTETVTGSNGQASYVPPLSFPQGFNTYAQTNVTATVGSSSVLFIETQIVPSSFDAYVPAQVNQISPSIVQTLTGSVGQIGTTPIQISVTTPYGGIPNIAVSLGPPLGTTWSGPTISCMTGPGQQSGTLLTNSAGLATCIPVFGGKPGNGYYGANVGEGLAQASPHPFMVTVGAPAAIKLITGNNQSVNPNTAAPLPLVAEVVDASGNPSVDAQVTWTVVPAGGATLSATTTTSDSYGEVTTRITAGSSGPIQVQVAVAKTSIQTAFTLNVNSAITAIQSISGNNQSVSVGSQFADPLIVQVNDGLTPASGATVRFAVTSGSATVSAPIATTNAEGQAQITATAGTGAGPIVITASVASGVQTFSQIFNLTVLPAGPGITAAGVTNAASFQSGSVSPCSLATIFGTGLANGFQGILSYFIEPQTQLNGVSVQFGSVSSPIFDLVNLNDQESVTVQVPCGIAPGASIPLTVTVGTGSTTIDIDVTAVSPGIFQSSMSDGKLRAVLLRQDGSFVSLQNPAQIGDTIRMFVTGLGETNPAIGTGEMTPLVAGPSGSLVPEVLPVIANVAVDLNNQSVKAISAQYADGMIGVYQVEFQIPTGTTAGSNIPLAISASTSSGTLSNASLIPIAQ